MDRNILKVSENFEIIRKTLDTKGGHFVEINVSTHG